MAESGAQTGVRIAIYGATGAMGRQVLLALEGYGLPVDNLVAVGGAAASPPGAGSAARAASPASAVTEPPNVPPSSSRILLRPGTAPTR